jgi:hypothetical protein
MLPRGALSILPPRPSGVPSHRELFDKNTAPVFDAVSPASSAADAVAQLLFNAQRASRLVQQNALDPAQPGLGAVLDSVLALASRGAAEAGYSGAVGRAVERVVADRLMELAQSARSSDVRAVAMDRLRAMRGRTSGAGDMSRAHQALLAADIGRFMERPWDPANLPRALPSPPGAPIGELEP